MSAAMIDTKVVVQDELTPATWHDGKRYAWLLGLLVPTLPFIAYGLVHLTGWGAAWFFGPVLVFGIFPIADLIVGMDAANPPDSVIKWLEQDRYYRWCTYAFLPIQFAGLGFACWLWSHGGLSTVDGIGLALTMAMVSGIAINTAHELGHKRASLERWLSKVALASSGYGHARGPRQLTPWRKLLGVSAAHGHRKSALELGSGGRAAVTDGEWALDVA
jgi:alkane 1-monooxygenase